MKGDGVADRNYIDDDFAVLIGFELESALVLVALDGMKDDVSIRNRLSVVVADDSDFNPRGGWRDFVFPAVVGVVILGAEVDAASDEAQ